MKLVISIIIPVYNASKYLGGCLDSLTNQTYTTWECILIDDGSTDDSGQICDEYAEKDSRFSVIHKANQGVSIARNAGIHESTGEWLYFCDADDEILPDGLETLIELTSSKAEIVFGGYVECCENGEVIASPRREEHCMLSAEEAILQLYLHPNSNYEGYLWCKLFHADLVKKNAILFSEHIYFNEDRLFVMQCLSHVSHPVVYKNLPVYRYYHHPQSAFWGLQQQWNPRYITDLRAYVNMYEVVCAATSDVYVRLVAKDGIRSSIKSIRRMLKRHHVKDPAVEDEMAKTERLFLGFRDKTQLFIMKRFPRFILHWI